MGSSNSPRPFLSSSQALSAKVREKILIHVVPLCSQLCGSFVASKEACGSLVSLLQRSSGAIQGIGCSGEVPACGQAWSRAVSLM